MSYFEIFKREIVNHSVSNNYADACLEWDEICIDDVSDDEDHECLCTHPIKQLITIRNRKNNREVIVGCDCIKKIEGMPNCALYQPVMNNLIELKQKPFQTTIGKHLIKFIRLNHIIEERHIAFLEKMRCKRKFTENQENYYNGLVRQILAVIGRRRRNPL